MRYKTLIEILSSLFILLFVYTAVSKWIDHRSFQNTIQQSPLIGSFAGVVAWALPLLELGISGLLFFESKRKAGFYAAGSLLIILTGYIGYMLLFSPHLPCSCGGVIKYLSWSEHLVFNVLWILLSLLGIVLSESDNRKGSQMKSELTI